MRRALAVGLLALADCTLSAPYPAIEPEVGDVACSDGIDQDLDGKTDCEDEDCAGRCQETGAAACADGWDQDGDGLADHQDPSCWSELRVAVDDCTSTYDPAGALSDTDPTAWIGTGRLLEYRDAEGALVRAMIGQLGQYLVSAHPSAGAVQGAALQLRVWLQASGRVQLHLLPGEALAAGSPDAAASRGVLVELGLTTTTDDRGLEVAPPWISVRGADGASALARLTPDRLPASTWVRVRIELSDGVRVFVGDEQEHLRFTRLGAETTPRLPESWSPAQALRFAWLAPSQAEARLREVRWSRPAHHPCGYAVPQLEGPVLAAHPLPSGRLCGLEWSWADLAIRAFVTEDGATVERLGSFVEPGLDAVAGALTWSEARRALVGVVALGRAPDISRVLLVESSDCARWSRSDLGLDPDLLYFVAPDGFAYEVSNEGHALHLPIASGDTVILRSPDGSPEGFRLDPEATYRRPVRTFESGYEGASVGHFGPERLALTFAGEGLVLHRALGGDRWSRLGVLAAPSRRVGRFDAAQVPWGAIVVSPPEPPLGEVQGWLLTRGDPGSTVAAPTSTAISRVRWYAR